MIHQRLLRDITVMRLLSNWREAIAAEIHNSRIYDLRLRNGVRLRSPAAIDLYFLFHEIWVAKIYTNGGYGISRGETVIDVGANIGVFTLLAAHAAPDVRVLAFEPFSENFEWLSSNVELSRARNVEMFRAAVAGKTGQRVLHVCDNNWIANAIADGATSPGTIVDAVSLEEVMERNRVVRCNLLKLDCEGSEFEILYNCPPAILRRIDRIVAEFHECHVQHREAGELRAFLKAMSFNVEFFTKTSPESGHLRARRQ